MIQNPMQLMQAFMQFKRMFTGDPKETVMRMLQDGSVTQAQLNDYQKMANELNAFMSKRN